MASSNDDNRKHTVGANLKYPFELIVLGILLRENREHPFSFLKMGVLY